MNSDQKFYLMIWALLATVLCVLIISLTLYYNSMNRKAAEAGLVQGSLPGLQGWYWVEKK